MSIKANPKKCAQGKSGYDMCSRPPPQKVTHRTSGRKRNKVDYSQFDLADDPPTPPKRKCTVDLKRKPSAGRIAAEKYKTKPANTPRPVRKSSLVCVPTTTSIKTDALQNAGKGLNGSPILTHISCHMVKRNTCVINAHTRTLIPATYEHIKGGTVMHYHLN